MDGMESRWYLAPGQTLQTTNISDLQHALHVTTPAWKKINAHLDRNRIIAETLEKERSYKRAMKEGSEAMTKNWPDTIERAHNRKTEERKQRAREEEDEKLQKYMELTKEQEDMRQAYIEKVKRSMYYGKAFPRKLNGALLESEAIYERQRQMEFKEKLKEHEKEEEMKWAERVKRAAEEEKRENLEKSTRELRKKKEVKEANVRNMTEKMELVKRQREERRRKQIVDNEHLRKEIELQEKMRQEDLRQVRETKRKELLEYIARDNAFKEHIAKEEVEVEEVIKIFDEAKRRIACLRKERDKELQQEAIARREVAGKEVMAIQQAKDEAFLKKIEKAQEEAAKKEEEARLKKIEKQEQMKKEREDDRREHIEREEKEKKVVEEIKRWELLNRQKQESVTKEYLEEKRKEEWQKTLQYRQELLEQIEEKKSQEKEEREEAMKSDDYILAGIEDKEFFAYAEGLVDSCMKKGRPTYPIYKVIEDYKKTNLLKEKDKPPCEDYMKSVKRNERLLNDAPGRRCHHPRTDPNYRRCRCQKERLYR